MAILRGNCHSTVKRANLFIKPYDFVECTPNFSIKFGSMVTNLSFFMSFKFTYLPLYQLVQNNNILFGYKNKNFSYIKAKTNEKNQKMFHANARCS